MGCLGGFARLWVLLSFSFVLSKLAYGQLVFGYLDLRAGALAELIVLPTVQAAVFWLVTRRARQTRGKER